MGRKRPLGMIGLYVHCSQKSASCNKSAFTSWKRFVINYSCVRIACDSLLKTSLLQVFNRLLQVDCQNLLQETCSKLFQQVLISIDLLQLDEIEKFVQLVDFISTFLT